MSHGHQNYDSHAQKAVPMDSHGHSQQAQHGVPMYDPRDYEERINRVFGRHPYVDVNKMMHNERLGFEPHEKQKLEEELRYGRPTQQHFGKTIASKGPNQMRYLYEIAREHDDPRYRAFADDIAREFRY